MSTDSASDTSGDAVLIDRDDVSDFNPDNILPMSADAIAKIRTWLQPTAYDDRFGEYQKHLASHAAGTGVWLTSSTTYREWLRSQQLGTLWVKGIPGSGKSVIAAQLIHDLAAQHPGTPVLYFFFRQIIDANHEPTALLRDWLDQVLLYSPPLQRCLNEYVEKRRSLDTLSMSELWRDLRLALGGLSNNAYCVVDALDEMDQGNDEFLRTLAELGLWKPGKIKVLMTSRPIARLEAVLRKTEMLQIRLDEDAVDKDISTYVQQKLSLTSITDSDRKLIMDAVPGRANGLFLYARLAMDAFLKPGANIGDVLTALPQDLNDMYTNLLRVHSLRSGIPPDLQRLILQCATHASRPLRLLEVAEMLEFTYLSQTEIKLKTTKEMVRTACGPLLEILLDETVCVVHHSFTEYLTGSNRPDTSVDYPTLKPGTTHNTLALACLSYLEYALQNIVSKRQLSEHLANPESLPCITGHDTDVLRGRAELRLKYPFIEYAVSNWHVHVTKSSLAGYNQEKVNEALQRLFNDTARLNAWLVLGWPRSAGSFSGLTQLHVAASFGLDSYIQELLKGGDIDANCQDKRGRTPLWWAASSGHAGAVGLLAQAGANPDQDDNHDGYKPLHKAAMANHAEVAKTLLQCGVSPMTGKTRDTPGRHCGNSPSTIGQTPLMYACQYGHVETVDVFMSSISDPDVVHRALQWATEMGKSANVRRILQHAEVAVKGEDRGHTLLALACSSRNADCVSALLEAGANPNSNESAQARTWRSGYYRSPLYNLCTATKRYDSDDDALETIFSQLVNSGIDVHQRHGDGSNALHWAINSPVLTRLLIDAGVDVNETSSDGATPLHKTKNNEVIGLLVSLGGANINQRNKEGQTPLLSCLIGVFSTSENLDRLLEFRPDCSVVDNKGNNIIHHLVRCRDDITKHLREVLDLGADPNYRNLSGDLPLHGISHNLKALEQTMDMLLSAGVDINAKDTQGSTVLYRAIADQWRESLKFVELLMGKGASLAVSDFQGRTLLHEAIKRQTLRRDLQFARDIDANFFEFLLARGLNSSAVDNHGNNLLHELAKRRENHDEYYAHAIIELWKHLLSLGLSLSQRNYNGRTPLHILCCSSSRLHVYRSSRMLAIDFVIQKMKSSGAMSVDVVDNAGITPLHLACTNSGSYVQKLLDAGANPTLTTLEGRTPLHLATQSRESNIVGILLDALYRRQMKETVPAGENCDKATPFIPRASWYHDNEFQFSPGVIDAQEATNSVNNYELGWTPLHYACRSGRPETVVLLLGAGANVDADSLIGACLQFEQEQSLWEKDYPYGEDLDAGGLLLNDTSRPATSSSRRAPGPRPGLPNQNTRIDEILEMILEKNMQYDPNREIQQNYLINGAFRSHRDYTVGCLATVRSLQNEYAKAKEQKPTEDNYALHQRRRVEEVTRQSLTEFKGIVNGKGNNDLFQTLMMRREYGAVRELARAGADFFQQDIPGSSNFKFLARQGFVSLAKGIVDDLYPELKDSDKEACSSQLSMTSGSQTKSDRFENSSYLLAAVRHDLPNMEMVRFLVEGCGVDMNRLHGEGGGKPMDGPLLSVAKGDQWWHAALAVPYFIKRSADLNIRNHLGQTPLHVALNSQSIFCEDIVRALVNAGADVNAIDAEGRSCISCAGEDAQMVQLLVKSGARADSHALFAAIDGNNHEALRVVLSAGVDPNTRRPEVKHSSKHQNRAAEEQLFALHYTAKMNSSEYYNSLRTEKESVLKEVRAKMTETLLEYGADPFATCLQRATVSKNVEGIGGSVTVWDSNESHIPRGYVQSTILHDLVEHSRIVEPFLKLTNLDIDRRDPKGRTLLLSACSSFSGPDTLIKIPPSSVEDPPMAGQSILKYLLSRGADPLARDDQGRNALHLMFDDTIQTWRPEDHSYDDSLSYMASKYPSLVNQKDKLGNTPLHLALHFATMRPKFMKVVTLLLQSGADPLLTDGDGNSTLHIIAGRLRNAEFRQLFQDMLGRGCNINSRNIRGETPLFSYYSSNSDNFDPEYSESDEFDSDEGDSWEPPNVSNAKAEARALWEASGADFTTRDDAGRGLLHLAARKTTKTFLELMNRGLDPMMDDENKQTPLDVAAACEKKKILALFARKKEE
ncbi:ankyrin repeat-containing domain protein [Xylaria bambusicola]|uniref:ankyrin repeat-containing domain protein n=1 Tax=Xylaria bambusicola TaxID=326684 RepID=UPI002007848B|nr:ankyrin repeat-containing domain protein [Xylaria bambusicola]KAI0516756.1 ankyrin repeat-containing domain protein [Xylaria bambusicola]